MGLCELLRSRNDFSVFAGGLFSFGKRANEDYDLVATDHCRDLDGRVPADVVGGCRPLISTEVRNSIPQPFLCKPSGLEPTCLGWGGRCGRRRRSWLRLRPSNNRYRSAFCNPRLRLAVKILAFHYQRVRKCVGRQRALHWLFPRPATE